MLPLDCGLDFDPAREEEFFAALPARPAVSLIEPRAELAGQQVNPVVSPADAASTAQASSARAQPYLLRTADLRRRLERLLRQREAASKRLNLRDFAGRVRYRLTGSKFEQSLVFYQHARELYPRRYRDLARLRPPALLKVNLANAYPRCYVTRRLSGRGLYYGPFPSRRAAEAFANEFLNLYKIRRCQIKIRRDPSFPGCIYSEMKMCLAPCFAGCTKEEYDAEVSRVVSFLGTSGAALTGELERERQAASDTLDFEGAAALHRRLERVAEVLRGLPELARPVEELDAVILQRAAEENTIAVFAVRGGFVADPFFLRFSELASRPRSVEEILREHLESAHGAICHSEGAERPGNPPGGFPQNATEADAGCSSREIPRSGRNDQVAEGRMANDGDALGGPSDQADRAQPEMALPHERSGEELGEHLALLTRWFYSKPRRGEIFFAEAPAARSKARAAESSTPEQLGLSFEAASPEPARDLPSPREWPYRRILRACSRLLAPPQEEKDQAQK